LVDMSEFSLAVRLSVPAYSCAGQTW
jgi:hypothetical protein